MAPVVLGLDIGGANLKAATADKRALSVPFALWKQPDRLPAALAELVAQFPDAEELAVTMTGELCDCYETKREGVNAILNAVLNVSRSRPVRVWSTDGRFVTTEEARRDHLKVAAANWHATATFAGRYAPNHRAILIDIGSTTTDIIPLRDGQPSTEGKTDQDRLESFELVYLGVRRTPVSSIFAGIGTCAELFATTQDVYLVLGLLSENPVNRDTADGRPLTRLYSLARLARMLGGDLETLPEERINRLAQECHRLIVSNLEHAAATVFFRTGEDESLPQCLIVSGAGEFITKSILQEFRQLAEVDRFVSLNDELGPTVSTCAPAYALAVLATERRA